MSEYTSSSVQFIPETLALREAGRREFDALAHGIRSADVLRLAQDLPQQMVLGSEPLEIAFAHIDRALPGWNLHLPEASQGLLQTARRGEQALTEALMGVAEELAGFERAAVADAVERVLPELHYGVIRVDGLHATAFEARRGHETFLVSIGDTGTVTTDQAGLADDTCLETQLAFTEGMAKMGVDLGPTATVRHHDPRGGSAIAVAARAGRSSLAAGAVATADAAYQGLTRPLLPGQTAPRTKLSEGEGR